MPWLTGYPREKVEWYPTIDEDLCVSCGMCMNCGKGVFDWTSAGARVARPYSCVVGCTTCATLCQGGAITFPDPGPLLELYRREGLWDKVKKVMEEEGKLKPVD